VNDFAIIKPLSPTSADWQSMGDVPKWITLGYDGCAWLHKDGFFVISSVEVAKDKDGFSLGPEYHLSLTLQTPSGPVRVDSNDAKWVLTEFKCDGADEDNHVENGLARNFWRPVNDNLVGSVCPCKDKEPKIVSDKGDFVIRPS